MPLRWFFVLSLLCVPVLSQAQCPGVTVQQSPFAKETLTISSTAIALTATIYKPTGVTPTMAMLTLEGGAIRYQVIGVPTATDGHPLAGSPAQTFTICGLDAITNFRAIRQTTDAILFVSYYKNKTP
jgi:hypothetical protein